MTDFAALLQPDRGQPAISLCRLTPAGLGAWLATQPPRVRAAVSGQRFAAKPDTLAILPGEAADAWSVVVGAGEDAPWALATVAARLPEGTYRLDGGDIGEAALGWMLAQHRFDRYRRTLPERAGPRVLLTRDPAAIGPIEALAEAVALVRDLVDTPAADLGPAELAGAVEAVGRRHGARVEVAAGETLADTYPMVHAVGRAAGRARGPRLIELRWGDPAHPRLAIVGKGVCFDSGGLDIKPSAGMLLMKKDMGGAAHALALAGLVMGAGLPVSLHLLIPAVENAIGGDAFRPGDILRARSGLHVEIGNTDAEGRLILADALTRAGEGDDGRTPALILDFATLTGAARVALGPELPALFANDDVLADRLLEAGREVADPLWRLPLWPGYAKMLKSDIADLNNAPAGGMAGAVTAALFLERFVPAGMPWAHLDTFAWNPAARPGRPKGGEALGLRAAWAMLQKRFARP